MGLHAGTRRSSPSLSAQSGWGAATNRDGVFLLEPVERIEFAVALVASRGQWHRFPFRIVEAMLCGHRTFDS